MKNILNKNFIYPLLLALLSITIAALNYTPGTILSGWDTLHPEFNFPLNFERTISGVFRPEQGLGAVAGHSHMADLPRIIFLFISSFILPMNFLRYFYVFLMLIIGPLGMYYFLLKVVIKEKTSSFLGALFYLLNIGTVQIFFVPFEMFVTQYGFLPWLFLFATQYLKSNEKKHLLFFSITTLLSTPIAYAATLWYVQFSFLLFYILVFAKLNKNSTKRALSLLAVTILINLFWILPNIYFLVNYGSAVMQANINKLFSPQAFLYNKEFGNLRDVILMKNFFFDWNIYDGKGNFIQLLTAWNSHLVNLLFLGILFSVTAISGIASGIFKKNKMIISLLPGLSICLFLLINDNFPTGFIYTFLQNSFPIFGEALRFPDNKVLGLYIFCFAVFFAFGIHTIVRIVPKKISPAISIITVTILIWFMVPAFQGNLISPQMRIKIPQEYFSLFDWFNKQEDSRKIANLPINSFWGWDYYNWHDDKSPSFQGAGFLWFGIKQPLLARDFDRWNPNNEQYYREMSYAVYSRNTDLITSVIKKYNIGYVLLDKSVIAPQNNPNVLFTKEIEEELEILVKNNIFKTPIKFGKIAVYQTTANQSVEKFSLLLPGIPNIYQDFSFQKYGNYISSANDFLLTDNSSMLKNDLYFTTAQGILIKKQKLTDLSLLDYITSENNITAEVIAQRDSLNKITVSFFPDSFSENTKSVPIVATAQLPGKAINNLTATTLSVNQKDNFSLKNLSIDKPLSLGRVILTTQKINTVSLYDDSKSQEVTPDFSTLKYILAPCSASQNENTFGIDIDENGDGFTLFGKDESICLTIPVSEISKIDPSKTITKDSLMGMRFSYKGSPNINICGVNLLTGGCFKSIQDQTSKVGSNDLGNLGIKITLDGLTHRTAPSTPFGTVLNKSTKQIEASYQDISFIITKPFYSAALDSNVLKTSLSQAGKTENKDALFIPFIKDDEFSKNITLTTQPINSCPGSQPDDVQKKINGGYIEYKSKKGSICDYFSYQNLPQNTAYGLVFTSKNVSGLPLTICVSNPYSNHCDIYAALPASKDKTQTVFILPPMSQSQTGFTIDVNNFAITGTESVNQLYSLQIVPFPYSWLTNISTAQELKDKRIVVYPYSFDKGWKAYEMVNGQSSMVNGVKHAFPFLFGTELKNHVKINNWENGWLLGNGQWSMVNGQSQIVIVYLPQYLEYFGFALLIGTFGYLTFLTFKPRRE